MEGSTSFQWCASISAIYLLILNRIGRRSATQTTLLVFYLFIAFPSALFKILRGQFGCWIAFLAILANLFLPQTFPFSRFTLFVIAPNTVANGLRDDIVGGIFCLIFGIILLATEIWETGGIANYRCTGHCFGYYFGIAILLLSAILYVCLGNW
ncbi:hypothetical protein MLD38_007737 [Melastoma candidum]|uniref:Uncharacterized protein n=1 Tax=Melastoma candidum TaxID=119954 RepID=A0ACB9RTD1_9MYRT|nr:hypothetical protein MLD38_007737 [Melastoma candidum]